MSDQKQIQHTGGVAIDEVKPKLKKPTVYRVILVNDDYTPMEFVVLVLQQFFRKGREEAVQIMLSVHTRGSGVCGVFTAEIAETKVRQVLSFSRDNKFHCSAPWSQSDVVLGPRNFPQCGDSKRAGGRA